VKPERDPSRASLRRGERARISSWLIDIRLGTVHPPGYSPHDETRSLLVKTLAGQTLLTIIIAVVAFTSGCNSPGNRADDPSLTAEIVWLGIDLSQATFVGKSGFNDPAKIKEYYFTAWNELIVEEANKFDIADYFGARKVKYEIDAVNGNNQLPDPATMVVSPGKEGTGPTADELKAMVKEYPLESTEGEGLVFIVECLNKAKKEASVWVVSFDIATRTVSTSRKVLGSPRGFGFRNYWVNSFYDVMKSYE
jgi:hypothetical protein